MTPFLSRDALKRILEAVAISSAATLFTWAIEELKEIRKVYKEKKQKEENERKHTA